MTSDEKHAELEADAGKLADRSPVLSAEQIEGERRLAQHRAQLAFFDLADE